MNPLKQHKIFVLLVLFIFFNSAIIAQQPINNSFENWEYDSTTYSNIPSEWNTNNFGWLNELQVVKSNDAQSGNYAVGLKTNWIANQYLVPGICIAKFPFTGRPNMMVGYVKGNLNNEDTFFALVELTKNGNTVASAFYYTIQSLNKYIKFNCFMEYFINDMPDSCTITLFTMGKELDDTNTFMLVDNLSFEYPSNVSNLSNEVFSIYPNPAKDFIEINTSENFNLSIYNSVGERVLFAENKNLISIALLPSGIYWVDIKTKHRNYSHKFIIENR